VTKKIQNNIPLPHVTCEQEEKYLSKFSNIALEAKTWCASEDAVESLIQVCVYVWVFLVHVFSGMYMGVVSKTRASDISMF
jgi:hypothetical protein